MPNDPYDTSMDDLTVSSLIARHIGPMLGPDAGTCYLCGRTVTNGHRRAPSSSFTAYADCVAGDVLCADCFACLSHWDCRGRSWMVTPDAFTPLTKESGPILRDALLSPPDGPYAIYVTAGRQKQGWLTLNRRVSTTRVAAMVGTDWTDRPVRIERAFTERRDPLIRRLREHKIPKAAMRLNDISPATWSKAIQEEWEDDLWMVAELAGDPRWEVLTHVCE